MNLNSLSAAERDQIMAANNKNGLLYHKNDTVGLTQVDVTLPEYANQFLIYNLHATNVLYISFDAGSTWFNIPALSTLSLDTCTVKYFSLKSNGASTNYQILYNY